MDKEQLAKDAERLLEDMTLKHALDAMRMDALEELAKADASVPHKIMTWQAKTAAIDDFRVQLKAYILNAKDEPKKAGFA